jgi:hypothetical protein
MATSPHRLDQRTVELPTRSKRWPAGPEVICVINRSLLRRLLRGLGDQRVEALLAPPPRTPTASSSARRSRHADIPDGLEHDDLGEVLAVDLPGVAGRGGVASPRKSSG